jgi:hypothetical protein
LIDGKKHLVRERPKVFSQMPTLNRRFNDFVDFAFAQIQDVVDSTQLDTCFRRSITSMASIALVNQGNGSFRVQPLPIEAQFAPVMGIEAIDLNDDEWLDIVLTGNMYGAEDDVVRYDAGKGLVLMGSPNGQFRPLTLFESGFVSQFDARGLVSIKNVNNPALPLIMVSAVNQGVSMVYVPHNSVADRLKTVAVNPASVRSFKAKMALGERKVEIYQGSAYRSQSSSNVLLPRTAEPILGKPGKPKKQSKPAR